MLFFAVNWLDPCYIIHFFGGFFKYNFASGQDLQSARIILYGIIR